MKNNANYNINGFTIMELIVIVIIVSIIAGFALPQYNKAIRKARERDAILQLKALHSANEYHKAQTGGYINLMGDLPVINTGFDLNIIANGMEYFIDGQDTDYQATAALSGIFTVQIDERPLSDSGDGSYANPCCSAGVCPSLPNCS